MGIRVAHSTRESVDVAVTELKAALGDSSARMVIFFASPAYDPHTLSERMQAVFSPATVIGSTTAGEMVSGKMLKNSVVAMALPPEVIEDASVEVVEGLRDGIRIESAFSAFEEHFKCSMQSLDPDEYVGLVLVDGLSRAEEKLMDRIGDLTNIFFVGGSAGDDLRLSQTYVFADGVAYTDAAVLVLIRPAVGFRIVKTQSFFALPKRLTATKVNEAEREVFEFNHRPAIEAYAEALGCTTDEVQDQFFKHPLGLVADGDIFVRSPQQTRVSAMVFYCNVLEGMELDLLESTDIVRDTQEAIESVRRESGEISGLINFNCILRTLELEQKGQTEAYGKLFSKIPMIGFSTYGEEYLGHINQTATMLVLL
jgi:hypothetical protein